MKQIQNITDAPYQRQSIVLDDGSRLNIRIIYRPNQSGWFFDEISWGRFTLRGLRISNSPNMLRQWKNGIPFGIACITDGNREPTQQKDFSSGASALYILSADEVSEYETALTED